MYDLLTTKWDIHTTLAIALIEHYGGHIYETYWALKRLKRQGKRFKPFRPELYSSVHRCLDSPIVNTTDMRDKLIQMLHTLAITGFCIVTSRLEPLAKLISLYEVGGLVSHDSYICDFPQPIMGSNLEYGLVPTQQYMRLIILIVLDKEGLLDVG